MAQPTLRTKVFLISSLGLALTGLSGCDPDQDLSTKTPKVETNELQEIIAFDYGQTGYQLHLNPNKPFWITALTTINGELRQKTTPLSTTKIKINNRDFRSYIKNPKGELQFAPSKNSNLVSASGFTVSSESEGIRVSLTFPLTGPILLLVESKEKATLTISGDSPKYSPRTLILEPGKELKQEFTPFEPSRRLSAIPLPIEIKGPAEDVKALQAIQFHLLAARPITPFGQTSEKYNGNVFWDADTWIFPALSLLDPLAAARIPRFRVETSGQAQFDALAWGTRDRRPTAKDQKLGNLPKETLTGHKFPWEANSLGQESSPSETKFQEHISADVALMLGQTLALGLDELDPILKPDLINHIISGTRTYYLNRITPGNPNELSSTISPSEWHTVNNDLYTNALLNVLYKIPMKLPRDKTTFLAFDNDKLSQYQQAAALLAIFPAQHPLVEAESRQMLLRFKDKASPTGPAMSHSINALIAARIGETDLAYDEWQKSWRNYTDDPVLYFREKPNQADTYFFTGAAGSLNAVLYGFLGLRIDRIPPTDKPWVIPLKNKMWLSANPNLPKEWSELNCQIKVLGKTYQLHVKNNILWVNGQEHGNSTGKKRQ